MNTRFFNATTFTPYADDDADWSNAKAVQFTGMAGVEAFGSLSVLAGWVVTATGMASEEVFGTAQVPGATETIFVEMLAGIEAFGTLQMTLFQAAPAWKHVKIVSPDTSEASVFFGYTGGPPTDGDWYEYEAFSFDGFPVTVNANGTYYIDGSNFLDPSDSFHGRWYSLIDSGWSALATVTLVSSPFSLGALTVVSKEAFGTAVLTAQSGGLVARPIVTKEAFGVPLLVLEGVMRPPSVASAEALGISTIIIASRLLLTGVATAEAIGAAKFVRIVYAGVVISGESFSEPSLTNFTNKLSPISVASKEALPSPELIVDRVLAVEGMEGTEAFGPVLIFSPGVWQEEAPQIGHWIQEDPQ